MFVIHTANLYLDKPFFSCSNRKYGYERREKQKDILNTIVNKVFEYKADALLITGNLFDAECVTEKTLQFLCKSLEAIKPVPVIIVPGSSDPISEYSPYGLETFPDNVVIMNLLDRTKWEAERIPLVVYSWACDGKGIEDLSEIEFPVETNGKNHILLSYDLPISHTEKLSQWFEKVSSVFSYIAIGKGYGFKQIYSTSRLTVCCCGAPDPISFNDTPPFGVVGIQFQINNNRWEVSQVEHISTQKSSYAVINVDASNILNKEELFLRMRSELNNMPKPCAVHFSFTGTISACILGTIPEIINLIQEESQSITWSIDGEMEGFENSGDMGSVTVLSEFFKQIGEEQKLAPNPYVRGVANRAGHLTKRVVEGIELKIPAVETSEVPLEWNL